MVEELQLLQEIRQIQLLGDIYRPAVTGMSFDDSDLVLADSKMMTLARWPNNIGTLLQPTLEAADSGTNDTTIVDADLTQACIE